MDGENADLDHRGLVYRVIFGEFSQISSVDTENCLIFHSGDEKNESTSRVSSVWG